MWRTLANTDFGTETRVTDVNTGAQGLKNKEFPCVRPGEDMSQLKRKFALLLSFCSVWALHGLDDACPYP